METKILDCVDCQEPFELSVSEQAFFEGKGLILPKRCKDCRIKKKQQKEQQGGR